MSDDLDGQEREAHLKWLLQRAERYIGEHCPTEDLQYEIRAALAVREEPKAGKPGSSYHNPIPVSNEDIARRMAASAERLQLREEELNQRQYVIEEKERIDAGQ